MKQHRLLKTIGIIVIVAVAIAGAGTLAIAIHPQLAVGAIQKLMYRENPVNTYSPLHKPSEGTTESGQYKITDRAYGKEYPNSYLDITYPSRNRDDKHPTLFYFHGGGFFGGSKDMGDPMAASEATALLDDLCAAGYTVVNVDYALVPDYHFPVPLIQANQAFAWAAKHADAYHLDMDHVIIMGSSAGAIMASQLGSVISNSKYADLIGVKPALSAKQVKAVVIDDAPLDYDSFDFACKLLIGNYVKGTTFLSKDDKSRYNNILHVTGKYPPAFLLGSEYRVDMNEMHEALDKVGVVNELVDPLKEEGRTMPHCFVAEERNDPTARKAFDRLTDFLDSHSI
ncbi:alpha/beta hydrolase [Bifidobacterium apri]|uniref:alpha/beta hydrolase n=1 Tax=Bifidobacterium apri TaxID=1769423 RepID=UPI003995F4A0